MSCHPMNTALNLTIKSSVPTAAAVAGLSVESEISPPGEAGTLFWMLPGPAAFLEHLSGLLSTHRAVAVHLSERTVLGHKGLIERALARSHFEGTLPVMLQVHDASQIDCDIAQHLCVNEVQRQIGGLSLADWHTRGRPPGSLAVAPNTFLLRPRGEQALQAAWRYLGDFVEGLQGSRGNTRIILVRIDNEPTWSEFELQSMRVSEHFEATHFSGALGPDEMRAYLGMRLAIAGSQRTSSPPGTLFAFPMNRLARSLIAEYAGFDAHFAEALIRMSEMEIMGLPASLGVLATRLPVSDAVWRQTSARAGTMVDIDGETAVHTLHEWHLACHAGPHQELATRELQRKKWRAYLSALMPWFEELRHALLMELRSLLLSHLASTHGERVRVDERTGRERRTPVDELECGDIAAMTKDNPPLHGQTSRERTALDLCHKVAKVRNEIAHLRPPKPDEIQKLITSLNCHLREVSESASS